MVFLWLRGKEGIGKQEGRKGLKLSSVLLRDSGELGKIMVREKGDGP